MTVARRTPMKYPISTGHAARLLDTTEPRIAELVRRGRVKPAPPVTAGRRLWDRAHVMQAAQQLGLLTRSLMERLDRELDKPDISDELDTDEPQL